MTVRIINADVLDGLRKLEDESVQCVVTSPPYWGLRDYGVDGQIGLEATPAEFVARMVEVFREVRRVLRSDGVCFVNLGDSYCSTDKWGGGGAGNSGKQTVASDGSVPSWAVRARKKPIPGIKPKDLVGIPWRVAFALQGDGWYLRGDYIWHKPNPMPESVTDRCTKAHEYIFHLSKSERYFWDQEAIKEMAAYGGQQLGIVRGVKVRAESMGRKPSGNEVPGADADSPVNRNKRSVWMIATAPFSEAHFATFPPELPEICIKAGSKPGDTILDPFGGAGTTGLVADRLQRNAVLIELNPEYAAMAERRINGDRGGLLDIMETEL